ncbi:MAG TPA: hypothetical protein VF130_05100, partial [Candidatus Binatia bacterium]
EALQRWVPDSGKTDPTLQCWRPITDAIRDFPAKTLRRKVYYFRTLRTWRLCALAGNIPTPLRLCRAI